MTKKKEVKFIGWTPVWWEHFFYFSEQPSYYTKQDVKFLRVPSITDKDTKYIDRRRII